MTPEEIIDIISKLNMEIWEAIGLEYEGAVFEYKSVGYTSLVEFLGNRIWFEDEDEREFQGDLDDYEPLEPYLRREAKKVIESLNKIWN